MKRNCKNCSTEFTFEATRKTTFCSRECWKDWCRKEKEKTKLCEWCKEPFGANRHTSELKDRRFCSKKCWTDSCSKSERLPCSEKGCNEPRKSRMAKFCGYHYQRHMNAKRRAAMPTRDCEACGKPFHPRPNEKTPARFCSRDCIYKESREKRAKTCTVSGCDRPRYTGKMDICHFHYEKKKQGIRKKDMKPMNPREHLMTAEKAKTRVKRGWTFLDFRKDRREYDSKTLNVSMMKLRCPRGHEAWHNVAAHARKATCIRCTCLENRETDEQVKAQLAEGHTLVSQRREDQVSKSGKKQHRHYVTIRCENGHEYESMFCNYKRKQACGKCAGKRLTDEDIAAMIRPGFTLRKIIRGKSPNPQHNVQLECENGHVYEQILYGHANGTGCRFCSGQYKKTDEEIRDALRPGYTFTGNRRITQKGRRQPSPQTQVEITCDKGHTRWQNWTSVAKGTGCYKCGGTAPLTEDEVKARVRVDDGYTFMGTRLKRSKKLNGRWSGANRQVKLCCSNGHVYWQPIVKHMNGAGCRECKYTGGYRTDRPGAYYYIRIDTPDGEVIYKHGITNREFLFNGNNIKSRYQLRDGKFCTVLLFLRFKDGRIPRKIETRVQRRVKKSQRYTGGWSFSCNTGNREIFAYDFLGLDPNAAKHNFGAINHERTASRVVAELE